jgi:hypothetical protein
MVELLKCASFRFNKRAQHCRKLVRALSVRASKLKSGSM